MRLAVTADLHGRWAEAVDFAARHRCEAILVAGDLGEAAYGAHWPVPVYWVWGDDDSRLVWRHTVGAGQVRNCQLIPTWTTASIGGLVILGVGAERDNAALPGPAVVLPPPGAVLTADIVLSHAAGWRQRIARDSHTYDVYAEQIGRAIRESGARVALSGHHHRWLQASSPLAAGAHHSWTNTVLRIGEPPGGLGGSGHMLATREPPRRLS